MICMLCISERIDGGIGDRIDGGFSERIDAGIGESQLWDRYVCMLCMHVCYVCIYVLYVCSFAISEVFGHNGMIQKVYL